jgi:hypothetical protein
MRTALQVPSRERREIDRQFSTPTDKIVGPTKFGGVCRYLWPRNTAAEIASIAGRNQRTAERWLSGEFEPPLIVVLAVVAKMFERQ